VVGAIAAAGMLAAGLTIPMLFAVAAICNAAVALFIYGLVPEFLLRFIVWMLIHTVYRLRVEALEQVPEEGPAVIICNHVSFVDPLVIMAACPRPIRFVMDHHIFRWPVMNFVFRSSKAIPIAPAKEDPTMMEKAFDEVGKALDAGDLVGIFPEGKITGDGEINPFRAPVRLHVGVVAGRTSGARRHWTEAHRLGLAGVHGEDIGMHVAQHRQVVAGGREVLADGQHLDVVGAQVAQRVEDFLVGLAEADHQADLVGTPARAP
jgi:1-acyl-sn-glycerol-3-phosphate acyltransferase